MTKSDFRTITEDVLAEFLPKTKVGERRDAVSELLSELISQGMELEDDENEEYPED